MFLLENSGSFKHDYKQINTLSKGHLKKTFTITTTRTAMIKIIIIMLMIMMILIIIM